MCGIESNSFFFLFLYLIKQKGRILKHSLVNKKSDKVSGLKTPTLKKRPSN